MHRAGVDGLVLVEVFHLELACLTAVRDTSPGQAFRVCFGRVLSLIMEGELENGLLARQLRFRNVYHGLTDRTKHVMQTHAKSTLIKMGLEAGYSDPFYLFTSPSKILFTEKQCSPCFRDSSGQQVSISETAQQLLRGEINKSDVEMLKVVEKGGKFYAIDNRRLALFRLLGMNGQVKIVKALVTADVPEELRKKLDTDLGTDGKSISLSGEGETIGATMAETSYLLFNGPRKKGAVDLAEKLKELDADVDGEKALLQNDPSKRRRITAEGEAVSVTSDA